MKFWNLSIKAKSPLDTYYKVSSDVLVLITYAQKLLLKTYADDSSRTRGLHFGQNLYLYPIFVYSKTCVKQSLKIDKTESLMTNGSLMKVKSIAECSSRAFCNTFDLH